MKKILMIVTTTLADTHPTLLDLTKRLDPKGQIDQIAELLTQTNEVLLDAVYLEANGTTSHRSTVRTGLPSATWRKMYGGVMPSKSRTAQITSNLGSLEAYAEVDKELIKLAGDPKQFRLSEDMAFIEGMNQELASTIFYGDESTAPEEFTGLAPRYNDQSAENGSNIITSAATPDNSDNTSIWLMVWGPNTIHMLYPKGSKAGIDMQDLGEVTAGDSTNGYFQAMRSHYMLKAGLHVKDWRYAVRINFDLEDVIAAGTSGPVLSDLMAQAIRRIPNLGMGRPAFYANRDVLEKLDIQSMNKANVNFTTIEDSQGKFVTTFRKIPIRQVDAILSTESGI